MSDHKDAIRPIGEPINTGTSDSILASLFRVILNENGVSPIKFNTLIDKYIARTSYNSPKNLKELSSTRGNIKKELLKSTMSWKVFVKGLMFLNIRKFRLTVELYTSQGIRVHSKMVDLDPGHEDYFNE